MAAGPWKIYDVAVKYLIDETSRIELLTHTLNCILVASTYTPAATHGVYADVSGHEIANGNGYTTGGVALASKTVTEASGITKFSCANIDWLAVGGSITARYAVIRDATQNHLIACALLDTTPSDVVALNGTTFLITIGSGGILQATARAQW